MDLPCVRIADMLQTHLLECKVEVLGQVFLQVRCGAQRPRRAFIARALAAPPRPASSPPTLCAPLLLSPLL